MLAAGYWLSTRPASTVSLLAVVTVPRLKPAVLRVVAAALWVRPTTLGTLTGAGPLEMTRSTAVPAATLVLAVGYWLSTGRRRRCRCWRW